MDGLTLEELRRMLGANKIVACNTDGIEIGSAEKGDAMYKMSDAEVNQYIQGLLSHPTEDLAAEGLELEAVLMLRDLNQELKLSQLGLQKKVEEKNALRNRIQELKGKLAACAQLLVRAEEARATKQMNTLRDLNQEENNSATEEGQSGTGSEEAPDGSENARVVSISG